MSHQFIIRNEERGHDMIKSDGSRSSYIAGHPDGFVTRASSFNFHEYQGGRPGFGPVRVFGDEVFHGTGCGYNMHPHHNFVICAFVFAGELTHINTAGGGTVDRLAAGDYYVFSAGSGGKHSELSVTPEDMHAIYLWLLPKQLYLPPSYHRAHFDFRTRRNAIVQLVGDGDGALPVDQDLRVSRLIADSGKSFAYPLRSVSHGVYVFVREGSVRCDTTVLNARDSTGIWNASTVDFEILEDDTDVIVVETLMIDDTIQQKWEHDHVHH
ncbi:pirin family protein [Rhizobiaceae bacterium n13]|uniref:Pirin family protein n=1 Tax=Ferirhizobium litorale TaxID=2927786 RepID=A0AAE3QBU3_9HYPH|nr:pirin family protein [Fererhizobium litorale]MDI7865136.1 pirin family protein [Fererhizobium litorale]MDI7922892.1 pirin family protein [Fererhizobium litorale]